MTAMQGLEALAHGAVLSSFTRTNRLLGAVSPGHARPIEMTAGDPKEAMPGFVAEKLLEARELLGTYPKIRGSDALRGAISAWIGRRYGLAEALDPAREPLSGSTSRAGSSASARP